MTKKEKEHSMIPTIQNPKTSFETASDGRHTVVRLTRAAGDVFEFRARWMLGDVSPGLVSSQVSEMQMQSQQHVSEVGQ